MQWRLRWQRPLLGTWQISPYDKFPWELAQSDQKDQKTNKQTAQNFSLSNQLSNEHHMCTFWITETKLSTHTYPTKNIRQHIHISKTQRENYKFSLEGLCFSTVRILKKKKKIIKLDFSNLIAYTIKSPILAIFREISFNSQSCEYLFVYS